jgi:hypothetical protein
VLAAGPRTDEDDRVTDSEAASPRLRPLYVVAFESTPSAIPGAEALPVLPMLAGLALADGTAATESPSAR